MSETPRQYGDEDDNPRVRNLEDCAGYSHDQAEKMVGVESSERPSASSIRQHAPGSSSSQRSSRRRAVVGPQYADGARAELGIDDVPPYEPLSQQQQATNRRGRQIAEHALQLSQQRMLERVREGAARVGVNQDAAVRAYLERQSRSGR